MSVRMMTLVFEHYPNGGGERCLALALADCAHDDGSHVFPSVATLAHKSRQSDRTVQRQLQVMVGYGWLLVIREGGGRLKATEYRINPDWIADPAGFAFKSEKGDILSPFSEAKGCHSCVTVSDAERVTNSAEKGDIAVSPEQELNLNPPLSPHTASAGCTVPSDNAAAEKSEDADDRVLAGWMLERLRKLNPTHGEPNWRRWCREIRLMRQRDGRTRREIAELFAWANADAFWQTNILSPGKLRAQWDQLALKRGVARRSSGAGSAAVSSSYQCIGPDDGIPCPHGRRGTRSLGLGGDGWVCDACGLERERHEAMAHG